MCRRITVYMCCFVKLKYIHYILFKVINFIFFYLCLLVYLFAGFQSQGSKAEGKLADLVFCEVRIINRI